MWTTNFYRIFSKKNFVHEQSAIENSFSTYVCYDMDGLFWLNLYSHKNNWSKFSTLWVILRSILRFGQGHPQRYRKNCRRRYVSISPFCSLQNKHDTKWRGVPNLHFIFKHLLFLHHIFLSFLFFCHSKNYFRMSQNFYSWQLYKSSFIKVCTLHIVGVLLDTLKKEFL